MRSGAMAASARESILLFSWGANSYGQLGIGNTIDQSSPVFLENPIQKWQQITGGGAHTLLLTSNGDLYSCGWNKEEQLGHQLLQKDKSLNIPKHIPDLPKILKVACGWSHNLAIDEHGRLISWGSNKYGQLGGAQESGNTSLYIILDKAAFNSEPVIDIGAGLRHSAAINGTGSLFTWGDGKKGQLGHPDLTTIKKPTQVSSMAGMICEGVSLGSHFTAVRTVEGDVYCFGDNRHGQCGAPPPNNAVGDASKLVLLPNKVDRLPPVSEIHCGWSHCLAVTKGEDKRRKMIYSWGRGDYGQLGIGNTIDQYQPQEISSLHGVQQVCCGSEHNLAINGDGELFSWGWNEHGSCGNADTSNRLTPGLVLLPKSHDLEKSTSESPTLNVIIGSGAGCSFISTITNT
ncbi:PREDICTED: secretion-regulating guanine nucleotide exchange factor-like [Amphimedon queenslandica]|uniref:RCC1-like domain-containing protein n=1 Tax=Amphimedon queenslandica TaxID=400682 RepID=A0AAN0IZC4_AMPQE|nr:PREDICTED: secretion-regulating guanine nucleotide exchange factor-like [Amphimedon queenslandica]|eukprot:XP_019850124.1 PREDICTED: secretion-regulating guanine nucleotide exchange factor-like [Amphimedon queenslandica]